MKNTCALVLTLVIVAVSGPVVARADTWADQINDPTRFVLLAGYGGTAVLDQETGLIWEQSPDTTTQRWDYAQASCNATRVGNRQG